jgi:hypothetical protein
VAEPAGPTLVIWGTDVNVNDSKRIFKRFIENFIEPNVEEDEINITMADRNEPLYLQKLKEVRFILIHDYRYVNLFCPSLNHKHGYLLYIIAVLIIT